VDAAAPDAQVHVAHCDEPFEILGEPSCLEDRVFGHACLPRLLNGARIILEILRSRNLRRARIAGTIGLFSARERRRDVRI
jgi:hypothetical protein